MTLPVERGLAKTFAGHIHWQACGSGPVVMVSHINQQSSALMAELLQALGAHFRAVAIDYPSHGHSDHIDWQPGIEDYARAVIETMEALKIERAAALGEAVGAAVSIALAAAHRQGRAGEHAVLHQCRDREERHRRHCQGEAERRIRIPGAALDRIPA